MKKATWMENLGVDWPSKSSEVVKKALETKLENNGGEFQTQEQMERIIYTMDKKIYNLVLEGEINGKDINSDQEQR